MSRSWVSLATGALAPLPLLVGLQVLSAGGSVIGPVPWKFVLLAATLASLACVLWPPIRPALFAAAFAVACPLWYTLLIGAARSGNLFGLGLILIAGAGALVASTAAALGAALRRFRLPSWAPAAPVMAAALTLIAAGALRSTAHDPDPSRLATFFAQLDAAERSYAAGPPFRGFTCNGPDLASLPGIEWRTDYNFGGRDRNQGPYAGYWIVLHCQPAARPTFYTVMAAPTSGVGQILNYDSRTGRVSGRPVR